MLGSGYGAFEMVRRCCGEFKAVEEVNTDIFNIADGRCAIEIRLKEDLWYTGRDAASFRDLKEGAVTVFAGCAVRERTGGVSRFHGK